jgi:hypothetical protein
MSCCQQGETLGQVVAAQTVIATSGAPMNGDHLAVRLHFLEQMAFEFFMPLARLHDIAVSSRVDEDKSAIGVVLEGTTGNVHDEAAFRHFLDLERRRAALVDRPCMLLFVSLRRDSLGSRETTSIPRALSASLFAALEESVREVDLVGWYRQGRIAAVLLTQAVDAPGSVRSVVTERVKQNLSRRLPEIAARLRVRVLRLSNETA